MTPPTVLVERTFLEVLVDASHPAHTEVREQYLALVDDYEQHRIRLRARHDHLETVPADLRRTLLAPVERIHVAAQHRRQATRIDLPAALADHVDHDVAVTFVVLRRERIGRVASLLPVFELVELPTPA